MTFADLALPAALLNALSVQGLTAPTPVQAEASPPLLAGHDLLAQAQTGSGKTLAYTLPLLAQWLHAERRTPRNVRGLVLVPTRELADQVGQTLAGLCADWPQRPKLAVVYGGVSINPQLMHLRGGADIVIATPGRLIDLVQHRALTLATVATLVLDEADRLLQLGFADELAQILAWLPARRQTALLSATFPDQVDELARGVLHRPQRVTVDATPETRPDIQQHAVVVDADRRTLLLRHLIQTRHAEERVLVFVASKYGAELVAHKLARNGVRAAAFHGELSQGTRRATLAALRDGSLQVVVATDVAARGIDIARLPVVVNFDLPRSPADHIHRIGRTGRAGEAGTAYSFVPPEAESHFRLIEKRQGLRVPRETVEGFEPRAVPDSTESPMAVAPIDPNGGVKGRRKSKKDKLREQAAQAAQTASGRPRSRKG
ncbi:MAG: DEAD/DEAH box helicase [Aquabacterium sp.]